MIVLRILGFMVSGDRVHRYRTVESFRNLLRLFEVVIRKSYHIAAKYYDVRIRLFYMLYYLIRERSLVKIRYEKYLVAVEPVRHVAVRVRILRKSYRLVRGRIAGEGGDRSNND